MNSNNNSDNNNGITSGDMGSEPDGWDAFGYAAQEPHPINWNTLSAADAEEEWLGLNAWVNWLRRTYGLPATIIPPMWHRHPELVWELSALHQHWLASYQDDQLPSAAIAWHRDFADARARLRDWVTISGTRLHTDRPTRQTTWPGEPAAEPVQDQPITDRDQDFVTFVIADVAGRKGAGDGLAAAEQTDAGGDGIGW